MRRIQIKVSETDFQKYNLGNEEIKFSDLVEMISREYARQALLECNEIAKNVGLSQMSLDEINAEIKAVRDAKIHATSQTADLSSEREGTCPTTGGATQ